MFRRAALISLAAAAVIAVLTWIFNSPLEHVVVSPGGGCERPPPGVGCDPTPAIVEPRGYFGLVLVTVATWLTVFACIYLVHWKLQPRAKEPPKPPELPRARIV